MVLGLAVTTALVAAGLHRHLHPWVSVAMAYVIFRSSAFAAAALGTGALDEIPPARTGPYMLVGILEDALAAIDAFGPLGWALGTVAGVGVGLRAAALLKLL